MTRESINPSKTKQSIHCAVKLKNFPPSPHWPPTPRARNDFAERFADRGEQPPEGQPQHLQEVNCSGSLGFRGQREVKRREHARGAGGAFKHLP